MGLYYGSLNDGQGLSGSHSAYMLLYEGDNLMQYFQNDYIKYISSNNTLGMHMGNCRQQFSGETAVVSNASKFCENAKFPHWKSCNWKADADLLRSRCDVCDNMRQVHFTK